MCLSAAYQREANRIITQNRQLLRTASDASPVKICLPSPKIDSPRVSDDSQRLIDDSLMVNLDSRSLVFQSSTASFQTNCLTTDQNITVFQAARLIFKAKRLSIESQRPIDEHFMVNDDARSIIVDPLKSNFPASRLNPVNRLIDYSLTNHCHAYPLL